MKFTPIEAFVLWLALFGALETWCARRRRTRAEQRTRSVFAGNTTPIR